MSTYILALACEFFVPSALAGLAIIAAEALPAGEPHFSKTMARVRFLIHISYHFLKMWSALAGLAIIAAEAQPAGEPHFSRIMARVWCRMSPYKAGCRRQVKHVKQLSGSNRRQRKTPVACQVMPSEQFGPAKRTQRITLAFGCFLTTRNSTAA